MTNNAYSYIEQLPYILQILAQRCVDQLIAATDDPATHNPDLVGKLQRNLSGILRNLTLVERLTKTPDTVKESKPKTPPAITPAPQEEREEPEQSVEPQPAPLPAQQFQLPAEPSQSEALPEKLQSLPTSPPPAAPPHSVVPPKYRTTFSPTSKKVKHRRPQTKGAFGISKFRRQHKNRSKNRPNSPLRT